LNLQRVVFVVGVVAEVAGVNGTAGQRLTRRGGKARIAECGNAVQEIFAAI
jgi:hypothetical protein